jgi:hypothetical protein
LPKANVIVPGWRWAVSGASSTTPSNPSRLRYRAVGASWSMTRRIVEWTPSAPISTSALALVPSAKWAVTPSGCSSTRISLLAL